VVQAISGVHAETIKAKKNIIQWKIRKGDFAGAKADLTGEAAYEFFDKLLTLVLPKIKDWPGMKWTAGDGSGNVAIGLEPEWMAFFPELEFNYDVSYSTQLRSCISGLTIFADVSTSTGAGLQHQHQDVCDIRQTSTSSPGGVGHALLRPAEEEALNIDVAGIRIVRCRSQNVYQCMSMALSLQMP
jgi:hypothetical protein